MKGSLRIGTIAGVPIRMHWSLVILVLFAVGPGMTASMALSVPGWLVAVFACVLVHELAHSLLARHRSFKVRDVILMPLGGFSEIIANSPTDEISLVGALTNWILAALLTIVAVSSRMELWPPTLFARAWLVRIICARQAQLTTGAAARWWTRATRVPRSVAGSCGGNGDRGAACWSTSGWHSSASSCFLGPASNNGWRQRANCCAVSK